MNISRLEELIRNIADLRTELKLESPRSSEDISHQIIQLQSHLMNDFGPYIEEAIFNVHDEFCPDDEVRSPLDYLPSHFKKVGYNGKTRYEIPNGEGIPVEADDYPDFHTRLALVPAPTRLVLKAQESDFEEIVWVARES